MSLENMKKHPYFNYETTELVLSEVEGNKELNVVVLRSQLLRIGVPLCALCGWFFCREEK